MNKGKNIYIFLILAASRMCYFGEKIEFLVFTKTFFVDKTGNIGQ